MTNCGGKRLPNTTRGRTRTDFMVAELLVEVQLLEVGPVQHDAQYKLVGTVL